MKLCIALLTLLACSSHAAPLMEGENVFPAGMNGIKRYRIPGAVVTAKGTVLREIMRRNYNSDVDGGSE